MADEKKIKGITGTQKTDSVDKLQGVDEVKKAESVKGIKATQGIALRRATTLMTSAEREKFFKMIDEEAERLAAEGAIPKRDKNIVTKAVKMAVESGILPDDSE